MLELAAGHDVSVGVGGVGVSTMIGLTSHRQPSPGPLGSQRHPHFSLPPVGLPRWHERYGTQLPTQETKEIQSLVWEDPLEEGTAAHSSILAWRIPVNRGA